uniref:Lipocalin/cytosolic fatty-acid binding domain-containing protein n=1 Tax=Moschus moschiferus TaxID=68415 RepID=A0A8C6E8N4_MOSMO
RLPREFCFQLSDQWRTVYMGSTNPEKIQENGPFRTYFRKVVFHDEKGTVDLYFYVKRNGKWKNVHVAGTKKDDGTFAIDYEGQNEFKVISASETHLVAQNVNVDESGKKTEFTGLFVKGSDIEDEALEKFKEFTRKRGIKEENIMHIKKSGKGMTLFPNYIIYLPGM